MERLRIIWLMEYFQIPGWRLQETLGVSRSSVRRWLKGFEEGKLGKGNEPKEPVNKTPREIAELSWEIFARNPLWGRYRIAMTLWGLEVFVSEVFAALLGDWNIKRRFGAVGRHGSIAVTERAIPTLKQEWLRRVPVIRGLDHSTQLLDDFSEH